VKTKRKKQKKDDTDGERRCFITKNGDLRVRMWNSENGTKAQSRSFKLATFCYRCSL
jgi:hypothetical protein